MEQRWTGRIVWIVVFVTVLFAVDRLGGRALEALLMRSQFRYSLLYGGRADAELVIMGNSRSVNSFYQPWVEESTQRTTLNMGYNGLSAGVVHALGLDYFEFSEPPKLLVVETTILAGDLDTPGLLETFKPYSLESTRLRAMLQEEAPRRSATRLSRLYCYNSELFMRALYYLDRTDQTWINRYRINQKMLDSVAETKPFELECDSDRLALLADLIDRARRRNVEVRLVLSPFLPAYAARITNLDEYLSAIEAKTGLKVWNYATAVDEVDAFADRVHLNEYGSGILLKRMVADGFFEL